MKFTFNHDAPTLEEAIGVSTEKGEEIIEMYTTSIRKSFREEKVSQCVEKFLEKTPIEHIVYLFIVQRVIPSMIKLRENPTAGAVASFLELLEKEIEKGKKS